MISKFYHNFPDLGIVLFFPLDRLITLIWLELYLLGSQLYLLSQRIIFSEGRMGNNYRNLSFFFSSMHIFCEAISFLGIGIETIVIEVGSVGRYSRYIIFLQSH